MDMERVTWISPMAEKMLKEGGRVCGVFSSALAISCGELAVTLQRDNIVTPLGGVLKRYNPETWRGFLGEEVSWAGNMLLFGNRLCCDMSKARRWQELSVECLPAMKKTEYARAKDELKRSLNNCRREMGASLLLEMLGWSQGREPEDAKYFYRFGEHVKHFRQGILEADLSMIKKAQEGLVGLGTGLTPSGDDFLVGFWSAVQMHYRGRHMAVYGEAIDSLTNLSKRTTRYGWSELWAMQQGLLSRPLARAIKLEDFKELSKIGGTTGADTLLGIAEAFSLMEVLDEEEFWPG